MPEAAGREALEVPGTVRELLRTRSCASSCKRGACVRDRARGGRVEPAAPAAGDAVVVEIAPYDAGRGRIVRRR